MIKCLLSIIIWVTFFDQKQPVNFIHSILSIYVYFLDPNAAKIRLDKPNIVTQEGNIATLAVSVSGYPQPDVYWRKGRRDIDVRRGKYKTLSDGSLQASTFCSHWI